MMHRVNDRKIGATVDRTNVPSLTREESTVRDLSGFPH